MVRSAVVLPGAKFGPHTPTLAYPRFAAEARGAAITAVEWTHPDPASIPEDERIAWVADAIVGHLPDGARPLLIARSLGTYASPLAATRGLPAIWINPVLTDPAVVEGMRRRTAPALLIGGSADPMWDGALAREVGSAVLEVEGADHGLMRPGPLSASASALGELATAVEAFLDALDRAHWPE